MSQVANIMPKLDSIQNLVETTFREDKVPATLITNITDDAGELTNQDIREITPEEVTSNNAPVQAYSPTIKNVVTYSTIPNTSSTSITSILKTM